MVDTANIPVIDLHANEPDADIARKLTDAAIEHGFLYIKNNGFDIAAEKIDDIFNVVGCDDPPSPDLIMPWPIRTGVWFNGMLKSFQLKTLFSSGPEEKEQCKMQKNNRGWSGMHQETLDPKHHKVSTPYQVS
jgi:hypothetical protein